MAYFNKAQRKLILMLLSIFNKKNVRKALVNYLEKNHVVMPTTPRVLFSNDFVSRSIMINGIYELEILNNLIRFLPKNGVVLDIGANIGNHTLFFANYVSKVYSFEPVPETFEILELNTRGLDNVEIYNYGLSEYYQEIDLFVPNDNRGAASHEFNPTSQAQKVVLKKFDEIGLFDDVRIDFIKIDVEGFELSVLKGMYNCLTKFSPFIAFEFDRENAPEVIDFLKSQGYKYFLNLSNNKSFKLSGAKVSLVLAGKSSI